MNDWHGVVSFLEAGTQVEPRTSVSDLQVEPNILVSGLHTLMEQLRRNGPNVGAIWLSPMDVSILHKSTVFDSIPYDPHQRPDRGFHGPTLQGHLFGAEVVQSLHVHTGSAVIVPMGMTVTNVSSESAQEIPGYRGATIRSERSAGRPWWERLDPPDR